MNILKTNTDNIAKPAISLILIGVLKGYIKNPVGFLIKSKMSFRKYRKNIEIDLPKDFVDSISFIAWLYIRLRKKIEQEKAFEIIRTAILTSGLAVQQANFRNVESNRSFENLIEYQQRANTEGSTKLNTMEIVEQSEKKYEFRVTRCVFFELFTYLKVPELTLIMCSIDNAIFNSYLPENLIFHRNGLNKTLVQGHKCCEFVIENKEWKVENQKKVIEMILDGHTDTPYGKDNLKKNIDRIRGLDISTKEKELILGGNMRRLLKI